jgi:phosphoribosyl 1,2-cyclic phosphate phosphodiesterase
MRATLLGCGGSGGVPLATGDWGACDPAEPRNRRLRVSLLVESAGGTRILIDASPDLRQQALSVGGLDRLDAVLFTHAHADHCHGIDDLRRICRLMEGAIPAYGNKATMTELDERFGYVFAPMKPGLGWYKPHLPAQVVADEPFEIGPIRVTPFAQDHIVMETLGFRFDAGGKSLAYSIDLKNLGDAGFAVVAGVDLWIVDCLNLTENPIHSDLKRSLAWIERAKPKRALLSHMADDIAYEAVDCATPDHVAPACDGLEVVL